MQFIPFIPSAEKGSPESVAELDHLRKGVHVASVFPVSRSRIYENESRLAQLLNGQEMNDGLIVENP